MTREVWAASWFFDGIVSHAGSSTIRVILRDKSPETRERVLAISADAGCTWEFSTPDFHFAVDVPKSVNYGSLRVILLQLISDGAIEVEEAFIAEHHGRQIDSWHRASSTPVARVVRVNRGRRDG
ncbi:DUF4265 domain-containing protein [Micromonospora sp. HM5-17]|uniref:DUF4265 domain-containing protein n=1 Tax=Micromonospora sp. HM5-17 TaxID=2487710 RepID=UPI001315AD88